MRVISQNGTIDVPYEMITLHVDEEIICMNTVRDIGAWSSVMARYSTNERAEKAMEMLHEVYVNSVSKFPMELENMKAIRAILKKRTGIVCISVSDQQINLEMSNIVFRFPQDDEV